MTGAAVGTLHDGAGDRPAKMLGTQADMSLALIVNSLYSIASQLLLEPTLLPLPTIPGSSQARELPSSPDKRKRAFGEGEVKSLTSQIAQVAVEVAYGVAGLSPLPFVHAFVEM